MHNFNKDTEYFYIDYINRELYKNSFFTKRGSYVPRVIFINRIYRSTYWFPFKVGNNLQKKKRFRLKYKTVHSSFFLSKLTFQDMFKLHVAVIHNYNLDSYLVSADFLRTLSLLNETVRKQEFKKLLPKIRPNSFNVWKTPPLVNRNINLRYFYDFSVHRVLSRFRKFNFLLLNKWDLNRKWLFSFSKMKTRYLRKFRYEYFMFRFYRLPGMSYEYWAEQQLQYPYYNLNSFNLLSDTYNSSTFSNHYLPLAVNELKNFTSPQNSHFIQLSIFYWFLKSSVEPPLYSLPAYSSYSYPIHHYTYGAKYKYLKNYFAYLTPRYAHAYFSRFRKFNFTNVYPSLRWYTFVIKPVYWNLKEGLNLHPHEFWEWMDVNWWEDNIRFRFNRFSKATRKAKFKRNFDSDNWFGQYNIDIFWLYKSWVHENLFLELISSYYARYFNFKYLTPGSRFQTEYPQKKWSHFDPKWQDRLFEYTYHRHPDQYFLPSTKRFNLYYSRSVSTKRLNSFLMLNFAWRTNKSLLFLPRRLSRKALMRDSYLKDPLQSFRPCFNKLLNNLLNFTILMPFIAGDFLLVFKELELFRANLVFLINFFYASPISFKLTPVYVNFLLSYLTYSGIIKLDQLDFNGIRVDTYLDLFDFVCSSANLSRFDLAMHKEQVVVEYVAFERWYTLLVSQYIN